MSRKVVVLLSGGLDSAVTLAMLKSWDCDCKAIGFLYGQRHLKEITTAAKLAAYYGVPYVHGKVSFPVVSALIGPTGDLNKEAHGLPGSFVPGRNLVFIGLASSYAYGEGISAIAGGWNYTDYPGYPDCRPEFLGALQKALRLGLNKGLYIEAPVLHMTKEDIIAKGHQLKVPFELTWSCYQGGEKPCGECSSCKYRQEGFRSVGIEDPLI